MKISTRIRYSVRLMVFLAKTYDENIPIQMKRIAENENLSVRYLEQLIIPLRNASLVKSIQGKYGGYKLVRKPNDITIYDVVKTADGPVQLLDCIAGDENDCDFLMDCNLRRMWGLINQKIVDVFQEFTLQDFAENNLPGLPEIVCCKNG